MGRLIHFKVSGGSLASRNNTLEMEIVRLSLPLLDRPLIRYKEESEYDPIKKFTN